VEPFSDNPGAFAAVEIVEAGIAPGSGYGEVSF